MRLRKKITSIWNLFSVACLNNRKPISLNVKLTTRCNLKCKYCLVDKKIKQDLDKKLLFKMIDEFANDLVMVCLSGGEPLLYKDLGEVIDYIDKKDGMIIALFSNGYLMDDFKSYIKKIDFLQISIDGDEKTHDSLSLVKGSFKKAISAVKLGKKNHVPTSIFATINKKNLNCVDYIVNLSRELGVDCGFGYMFDMNQNKEGLDIVDTEKWRVFNYIIKLKKRNNHIFNAVTELKLYRDPPLKRKLKCFAGRFYSVVSPDGRFYPCTHVEQSNLDLRGVNAESQGIRNAFNNCLDIVGMEEVCQSCNLGCCTFIDSILTPSNIYDIIKYIRRYIKK